MILLLTSIYCLSIFIMLKHLEKVYPLPDISGLSDEQFNRELNQATSRNIIGAIFWPLTAIVLLSEDDCKGFKAVGYWLASWPVYVGIAAYFIVALMFAWIVALVRPVEEMG